MWDNLKKAANFADFEEMLADALIAQFALLGGDPREATRSAGKYTHIDDWVTYHKSQTIAAGIGSGLIPGASVALMSADLAFLLHKLAYMSWGIGEIKGCKVYSKPDFLHILQLWSEEDGDKSDMLAVSYGFVKAVNASVSLADLMNFEKLNEAQELAVYNELGKLYSSYGSISKTVDIWGNNEGEAGLKVKIARKKLIKVGAKLSHKLAKKLATKIASKMAAKFLLGFVPLVGAAASGYINNWMMNGIADSAKKYYGRAIKF